MNLVSTLIKILKPVGVEQFENEQGVTYNGELILKKPSGGYGWTLTSTGTALLGDYVNTVHKNYWPSCLLDLLRVQHNLHSCLFANKRARKREVEIMLHCLSNGRKNFPSVTHNIAELASNWEHLQTDTQRMLINYNIFDGAGEPIWNYKSRDVLAPDGNIVHRKVKEDDYRVAALPSLNDYQVTVLKTEPVTAVEFNGGTYNLTVGEIKYLEKHYKKCTKCGKYEAKDNVIFGFCQECAGDFPRELRGYSERAHALLQTAQLGKSKYPTILTGVELEYETSANMSEVLFLLYRNLKEHAIFKRDGSLSHGVEICTRPASTEVHTDTFKNFFGDEDLMERIEVKNTCGMHVHIDRRTMTALTLGKLISFMQSKGNKDFLGLIAGRVNNSYAKLATDLSITSMVRGRASQDRYQGLNVQNANTAEIRIFKTPSTYEEFLKNMEFVAAISSFVQPANSGVKDMCVDAFTKYVKDNRSTYQQLFKFTKEHGYA